MGLAVKLKSGRGLIEEIVAAFRVCPGQPFCTSLNGGKVVPNLTLISMNYKIRDILAGIKRDGSDGLLLRNGEISARPSGIRVLLIFQSSITLQIGIRNLLF